MKQEAYISRWEHVTVFVVALAIIALLVTPVLAVHTVEELYTQGERIASEVAELRKAVDDLRLSFENTINSTGVKLIVILSMEYLVLNCFYYLIMLIYNYRNRSVFKKQRDNYNLSLRTETALLKRKNDMLKRELTLLNDSHNSLLSVVSGVKEENPLFRLMLFAGIAFTLLMFTVSMGLSFLGSKFMDASIASYFIYVPAVLALFFSFIGFKFYKEDLTKLKQAIASKDARKPDDISVELVDIPTGDELTKPEPPKTLTPKMKALKDRITHMKGEKTDEEKKAEAEAKKAEAEAKKLAEEEAKKAVALPEGAEVKVQDGLVSISAPIKETDFTTEKLVEEKPKMDLPDIEEAVVETEEAKKFKMPDDIEEKVFAVLSDSPKAIVVGDIMRLLGLKGSKDAFIIGKTLRDLKKKQKVINRKAKDGTNFWQVVL
jgi:hypothetical protein